MCIRDRYGGIELTALAENLFDVDSHVCSEALRIISELGGGLSKNKIYLAVQLNLQLSRSFMSTTEGMRQTFEYLAKSFKTEFDLSKRDQKLINGKFREFKHISSKFFGTAELESKFEHEVKQLVDRYGQLIAPVANKISELITGEEQKINLLCSYLHMTNNRLFSDDARAQELVLYEVIHRSIESEIARKKYS